MNQQNKTYIISEDYVLTVILRKILKSSLYRPAIYSLHSFSDVKSIKSGEVIDLILLDDLLSGAASHEVVNTLRLEKKVKCPIYYLSNSESKEEKKALYRGANYLFKKPFKPEDLVQHIMTNTNLPMSKSITTEKEIINSILLQQQTNHNTNVQKDIYSIDN